jgi:HAD superfamily hydrolase (TIGR01450 family)
MWVLDLDGVVWLGDRPLAGAADAVALLRAGGHQVTFATNNSSAVVAEQEAKLARFGIPAQGDVVTSAMAGAGLVEPGERVLVCGGPGVVEAVLARGAEPIDASEAARAGRAVIEAVEVVMVGFHRNFDYERLRASAQAIAAGARFIATNDDATYPTPEGEIPGGGALAASIAYATGVQPLVAGKPEAPMAALIHQRATVRDPAEAPTAGAEASTPAPRPTGGLAPAEAPGAGPDDGIMVGDRPSTDGVFAATLGYRFGLVLTGVTTADDLPVTPAPDLVAPDLMSLVQTVLEA